MKARFYRLTAFFRERKLVTLALFYGAGVIVGYTCAFALLPTLLSVAFAAALLVLAVCFRRSRLLPCCLLFLTSGLLFSGIVSHPSLPDEGRFQVSGVVCTSVEITQEGKVKTYLQDVELTDADGNTARAGKCYFTWTPPEESIPVLQEGDRISLTGRVYHPSGQENPYGYDFRTYLLIKGVSYGVSCSSEVTVTESGIFTIGGFLSGIRQTLITRCRAVFGEQSALPEALLLGYREDLPDETNQAFSDAGIAHILAVSGLHVTLIAGMLHLLLGLFHLSPRARLIIISAFLLCYSAVLGFSAPVVRASLLTVLLLFAAVIRRRSDPLTALAAAFLIILLFQPLQLFSVSFQLSFCAVLGIILLGDRFASIRLKNRWLDALWRFWQTTFAATLGVTIPTICTFHRLSLVGYLINPFVCALMGILLPFYAVIYLAGLVFLPFGALLGKIAAPVTGIFTRAVEILSDLPGATVNVATPSIVVILLTVVLLLIVTRYVVISRKGRIVTGAVCVLGIVLVSIFSVDHSLRYVQLSAGQADCAVLIDDRQTVVIDTGENGGDLAAYLLSNGLNADTVVITHAHMDHIGGLQQLLDQHVRIGRVLLPEQADAFAGEDALALLERLQAENIPVQYVSRGDQLQTRRARLTVLWPEKDRISPAGAANNYSMVLYMDLDGVAMLEMSDLPTLYEEFCAVPAEIIKIAHHGSKTSTGDDFLNTVTPQLALITATRFSTSLPSAVTLDRLNNASVPYLRTDETGCLTIRCAQGTYQIETYRGK